MWSYRSGGKEGIEPRAFEVSPPQWMYILRDCIDGRLDCHSETFMGMKAVIKRDATLKLLDFIPSNKD